MSMRSSAACLVLLASLTAAASQNASARPPGLPLDLTITASQPDVDRDIKDLLRMVEQTYHRSILFGVGVNSDAGLSGCSLANERHFLDSLQPLPTGGVTGSGVFSCTYPAPCSLLPPCDDCPTCPEYRPCRRELTDCLLFGAHPAAAFLRTRLLLEFDEEDGLPIIVVSGRHIAVGGLLLRAAEAAGCGCFHPVALARMCWGVMAGERAERGAAEESQIPPQDTRPVARLQETDPSRFISGLTPAGTPSTDLDIPIQASSYEQLEVKPVEVEELSVPPVEIEPIPVMPVEIELQPFMPPAIDVRLPYPGGFRMLGGMQLRGVAASRTVDRSGPGVGVRFMQIMVAPKVLSSEAEAGEVEMVPILPAPACRCPWQERQPVMVQAAVTTKADWADDVRRNLKKVTKARRRLARAEQHCLDGKHDQARRGYERVQRLAPGSGPAERATERLQQLAAKDIIDRAAEVPVPPPERVHSGIMEDEPEAIEAGTSCCEFKQVLGRLLEQVGRGVCIDIDCGGVRTRARGQLQLGGLSIRLEYRGGQIELEMGLPANEPDDLNRD